MARELLTKSRDDQAVDEARFIDNALDNQQQKPHCFIFSSISLLLAINRSLCLNCTQLSKFIDPNFAPDGNLGVAACVELSFDKLLKTQIRQAGVLEQ